MFTTNSRYSITTFGAMLFVTIQVINYHYMTGHVSQMHQYLDSSPRASVLHRRASSSSRGASGGVAAGGGGGRRDLAVSTTSTSPELFQAHILSPEEHEERDRRLRLSETKSDLSELSEGTFGGCLMIMDDNHFLVEWLAYHWHVLPLRHLIVLVDDKSQTSPLGIFERWQDKMTIEVVDWKWPGILAPEKAVPGLENNTDIRHYIGRQNMFYQECMQTYKRRNWNNWIMLTDTDEFIGVNRWQNNKGYPMFDGVLPSANETGSVMKRIEQMSHEGDTCILTNRTHACEETKPIKSAASAELGFSDHDFLTFEWNLGHTLKNPKGMINIGKVDAEFFEDLDLNNNGNAHNIAPGLDCRDRSWFKMYHYPGSEKQRTFRDSIDPRGPAATRVGGSRPLIPRKCVNMPVVHLHPWLDGFVKTVGIGIDGARRLLDGVGQTGPWPKYQARIM